MSDIVRLKIVLERVKPQVLRRVEVPVDIKLDELHLAFQYAMGWHDEHLFEFRAGKSSWGTTDALTNHFGRLLPADRATLKDLLAKAGKKKAFQYLYDFGDSWMHSVTVEAVAPRSAGATYPRLIAAKGACPPEDIGGPWGYGIFVEAIADPGHERHAESIDRADPGFDPAAVDRERIEKRLALLAKRLAQAQAKVRRRR